MKKTTSLLCGILIASSLFAEKRQDGKTALVPRVCVDNEYDSKGKLTYSHESDGMEFWYDTNGNVIHGKGDTWEYWNKYDKQGNLINVKQKSGYQLWQKFDEHGNIIYKKNSNNEAIITNNEYDEKGNLIHFKATDGQEGWYEYDENGKMIRYKTALGFVISYEYDENGNLIREGGSSDKTEYEYDEKNRMISKKYYSSYDYWEYDEKGNTISHRDSNGEDEIYVYEYNNKNQIIREKFCVPFFELNTTVHTTCNLKLREGEDTSTDVITVMPENTYLILLETGKVEIIDKIEAPWTKVKVISENDLSKETIGWCFGGYLAK